MNLRGQPRLVDVAERAGVTVSTASRALARPEMVRAETRERVLAAARDLGYVPNVMARGLITGRTGVIAVLVPDLTMALFALSARAIESAARPRQYDIVVIDLEMNPKREAAVVDRVSRFADGIIIFMPQCDYERDSGRPPMVTVNRHTRGAHSVLLDQPWIADLQLQHLLALGHERILFVNGPKQYWAAHERRRHVERLATMHDIVMTEPLDPRFDAGVELGDHIPPDVTAVMTFADAQAVGLIARCAQLGIRVPEDLSVIGANDVPMARMVTPPLTTVRAPLEAMANTAITLLIDHIDASRGPTIIETHRSELVVRGSTAPPHERAVP